MGAQLLVTGMLLAVLVGGCATAPASCDVREDCLPVPAQQGRCPMDADAALTIEVIPRDQWDRDYIENESRMAEATVQWRMDGTEHEVKAPLNGYCASFGTVPQTELHVSISYWNDLCQLGAKVPFEFDGTPTTLPVPVQRKMCF